MIAFVLANLLGIAAITWPLLLGVTTRAAENQAHSVDAPVIIAFLVPLLVLVAIDAAKGQRDDARLLALLGVFVAINAFLRIPKGPSGEGLMFILPILCGWFMGARFAFLLGAFSILVSGLMTGGIGPWLPFQMFALGWVGAGAGGLRHITGGRFPLIVLGAYAYASSVLYGFVMTLWFWPFLGQGGPTFYAPGLGFSETLVRYLRFYSLTSLPWDTGRALLANVPLVLILRRPVGNLLERVRERFEAVAVRA